MAENTGVVRLGEGSESSRLQLPREIVVDRSWVHGIRARTTAAATGLDTLHIFFPGGVFTHNVLVHGDCSLYPAGNFCPPTIGDAGFVDYAGGDCRLAASSPYRGAGTEGADLGADIDVIGAATG